MYTRCILTFIFTSTSLHSFIFSSFPTFHLFIPSPIFQLISLFIVYLNLSLIPIPNNFQIFNQENQLLNRNVLAQNKTFCDRPKIDSVYLKHRFACFGAHPLVCLFSEIIIVSVVKSKYEND